jgi:hypothetical protein
MAVVASNGASTLDAYDIATLARSAGFTGQGLTNITAIALAESHGNPAAICNSCAGVKEYSVGLTQVNMDAHSNYSESYLLNPLNNLKAAYSISGGGKNFQPWTTYTKGTYKQFLQQAQLGAAGANYGSPLTPTQAKALGLYYTSGGSSSNAAESQAQSLQGIASSIANLPGTLIGDLLSSIPWVPIVEFIIGVLCILIGLIMLSGFNPASAVGKAAAVAA